MTAASFQAGPVGRRASARAVPRLVDVLPILAAITAALVAWWAAEPYVIGVFHDDGVYALLARSIAHGTGFHYIGIPGAPAATHYPPLYPLLLAVAWRVAPSFPDNIGVLLGLNAVLIGLATAGVYRFTRIRLGWRADVGALGALLTMVAPPVLALSGALLSESLFLALLWPTLVAAERAADRPDPRSGLLAGGAIGVLMLVRVHAVALLGALVIVLLLRRRAAQALAASIGAAVVLLPWQLWTAVASPALPGPLQGSYGSYLAWFFVGLRQGGLRFAAATARANLGECWLLLRDGVAPGALPLLAQPTTGFVALLIAAGWWRLSRRALVTALFLAGYLAIVMLWPYAPWRFVWAVWPLLLVLLVEGACWLTTNVQPLLPRAAVALALALALSAMARTELAAYASRGWSAPARQAGEQIAPLVRWVGRNTRPEDVIVTEGEQVITLFTGRRALPSAPFTALEYLGGHSEEENRDGLRAMVGIAQARYVLALAPGTLQAARSLSGMSPGLREITRLPGGAVFAVSR
jgi:hypothetical protein